MKKLPLVLLTCFILLGLLSCSNSSGGGGDSSYEETNKSTFSVTNLTFNSIDYKLSANISLVDESKVTIVCNEKEQEAIVADGKIALTFERPFYSGIKGGKSYTLIFKSEGYADTSATIQYWPKVESQLASKSEITVYNGVVEHLQAPEVILLNYDSDSVDTNVTYNVSDTNTASWTFNDLLEYLNKKENTDKSVKYEYKITPKTTSSIDLSDEGEVIYNCRQDTKVVSAYIHNDFGKFELYLYDTSYESEHELETAGGNIQYQWQVLNDEGPFDISGATGKTFTLTKENASTYLGKTLCVKIKQNYAGEDQPEFLSNTFPVYHVKKVKELYYDGVLSVGSVFDCSKIKGTVTDELGNKYDAASFTWFGISELEETDDSYYVGASSRKFSVTCENENFYPGDGAEIFAIVQAVLAQDEIPPLSTDITKMTVKKAQFLKSNQGLEISFNSCATFVDIPQDEFETYEGQELYIRKKSSGKVNEYGYIKESEPVKLTVKKENIGVKCEGSGLIAGIEVPNLSLTITNKNNKYLITPSVDLDSSKYTFSYTWKFDTTNIIDGSEKSGVSIEDNCLVVDKNKVSANIHRITCFAQICSNSTGESMTILETTTIDLR